MHPDDVIGVRGNESDVGHDGDDHVFLHVELSRVEIPGVAESGELSVGEDNLEQLAGGKSTDGVPVRRVKYAKIRTYSNWATLEPTAILGIRMVKNWLTKLPPETKMIPMTQARKVLAGMVGSS